jgi:hypothetical protein
MAMAASTITIPTRRAVLRVKVFLFVARLQVLQKIFLTLSS